MKLQMKMIGDSSRNTTHDNTQVSLLGPHFSKMVTSCCISKRPIFKSQNGKTRVMKESTNESALKIITSRDAKQDKHETRGRQNE